MRFLASILLSLTCTLGIACYPSGGQVAAPPPSPAPVAEPAPATPTRVAEPAPAASDCVASGCSGTVCVAAGQEIMSTCEFKPEYACYQKAKCERQASGSCGWTRSAELDACLAAGGPK